MLLRTVGIALKPQIDRGNIEFLKTGLAVFLNNVLRTRYANGPVMSLLASCKYNKLTSQQASNL